MRKTKLLLPILALLLTVGCAKSVKAPIPGSANAFDSQTYLDLVVADNVIQSTKADLANNSFPASIAGNVKTALNALIQAYDVANPVYQAYHAAAMAGTATQAQVSTVNAAMAGVQTASTNLITAKAGH